MSYRNVLLEFGLINLFIFFVFLVVLALGESYSISTSNQLLATLAGTVAPKLLQLIFGNKQSPSQIDGKDMGRLTTKPTK